MDCLDNKLMVWQAAEERPWRTAAPRFFGEAPRRGRRRGEGQGTRPKLTGETPGEGPRFVGE
jgi:hypothetical protein